jgi:hypothetical protein
MNAEEVEAFVDAAAVALGLTLDAAHRPGVLRYFALAASMAEQVTGEPLGSGDEPAYVFVPLGPEDLGDALGPAS